MHKIYIIDYSSPFSMQCLLTCMGFLIRTHLKIREFLVRNLEFREVILKNYVYTFAKKYTLKHFGLTALW